MKRTKLMFVIQDALGWKTYHARLSNIMGTRDDIEGMIVPFRFPYTASMFLRRNNLLRFDRLFRLLDPIAAMRGHVGDHLRRKIYSVRPDLVHFVAQWPAAVIAGETKKPLFTIALDHTRAAIETEFRPNVWKFSAMNREAQLLRDAQHVFPMSAWAATSLSRDCGVSPDRITIMPPSIDLSRFEPHRRGRSGLPRILFIGNDFYRKGGDRLRNWVLGPLAGRCELHVVSADRQLSSGDSQGVRWYGSVPNHDLIASVMPEMDIFCLPTRSDMSPWVLVEAAAAGLPSVASRIAGVPSLVEDGVTGYLAPPNDDSAFIRALAGLIDSPAMRAQMGECAIARARELFNANVNFNSLIDRLLLLCRSGSTRDQIPCDFVKPLS